MQKRMLAATLTTVAAMATLAFSSTPAEATQTRCRVPFSFQVRGQTFPPGEYTFSPGPVELWMFSDRHAAVVMTVGLQSSTDARPRAVFQRRGEVYVLRQVWTGSQGWELLPRRQPGERRPTAQEGDTVERVTIPAF